MGLGGLGDSFSTGVGKRIFGLFLLAAVLPMLFAAGMVYVELTRELREDAATSLNDRAKNYGNDVVARLEFTADKATEIARMISASGVPNVSVGEFLMDGFEAIWLLSQTSESRSTIVSLPMIDDTSVDVPFLRSGGTQLLLSDANELVMLRSATVNGGDDVIAFRLAGDFIWGHRDDLNLSTDYCVFTLAGDALSCTLKNSEQLHRVFVQETAGTESNAFVEWEDSGALKFAARWQLFLDASFRAEALHIAAIQRHGHSAYSGAGFYNVFLPSIILVVLLVGVLSLRVINRNLIPLRKLTRSANQVASGNLRARVDIRSDDEFQNLGTAFNSMAGSLGKQFAALKALSMIDRMILTGTSFDNVSEKVVGQLISLTGCKSAAVIAYDADSAGMGKMISAANGESSEHSRVAIPVEMDRLWSAEEARTAHAAPPKSPYADRFAEMGQQFVVTIPVILQDVPKGLLILGFDDPATLDDSDWQRCVDLASRFAVALTSVEREKTLYRQAHYDALTGLPNRQLLKDRLEQVLSSTRTGEEFGALLFLDLDRFKEVNDVYGHTVGDAVLTQAADRIVATVRGGDTVARLGGDEFVVLLPNVTDDGVVRSTASRLLEKLAEAFSVRNVDHYLGASIGIAMFPVDGSTVETLLQNADAAMYRAKDAGRNRFEFFSKNLNDASRRKISLERDLRVAVSNGDLEVYYQPQQNLATGEISGAEALVRWTHTDHGAVSPAEFIPLAEDTDLIVELGAFVLEQSCRDLRSILDKGWHPGILSINVSARQLADGNFRNAVLEPIRQYGIHPGFIQLEITETTVAQNRDIAIQILRSLREQEIRIALDDFGTGYSSLSYLENMPFDSIKIDKSFIDRIGTSETSDNICNTIIRMADELDKKSIAEGVEDVEQVNFLTRNGCNILQGYYYSKPLPIDEFSAFVEKQNFHTARRKVLEVLPA